MITLVRIIMLGSVGLLAASGCAVAQKVTAEARLKELNITLPPERMPGPGAHFINTSRTGNLLFLAGTRTEPDYPLQGKVGKDLTVEQGYAAARFVGIQTLATIRAAVGSLDRVKRVVIVLGMVNATEDFTGYAAVNNGFSDLYIDLFGEAIGKHPRSAIGILNARPGRNRSDRRSRADGMRSPAARAISRAITNTK
jgi:enamine deaminase RidA (YjgF/YER057c/UK114 family)